MVSPGNQRARQHSLKLQPGFKALQINPTLRDQRQTSRPLDSQAFTALGAARRDHSPTAAGFHTGQETVGAGAFDFRRLIGAFHDAVLDAVRADRPLV